jgi:hypothetical protein
MSASWHFAGVSGCPLVGELDRLRQGRLVAASSRAALDHRPKASVIGLTTAQGRALHRLAESQCWLKAAAGIQPKSDVMFKLSACRWLSAQAKRRVSRQPEAVDVSSSNFVCCGAASPRRAIPTHRFASWVQRSTARLAVDSVSSARLSQTQIFAELAASETQNSMAMWSRARLYLPAPRDGTR